VTVGSLQPYLSWIADRIAEARAWSADTVWLVVIGALVIVLLLLRALWKSSRRARALQRNVAALEAELSSSRRVLEEEIKWRQSAERRGAPVQQPLVHDTSPPVQISDSKPESDVTEPK
jgi:FtsZ-interacting cell division protein ZipA